MFKYTRYLLCLIGFLTASFTHAQTYYVAPDGSAAWSQCTDSSMPCNGKTAVENAIAGDIVYFRGGTYDPAANPVASWSNTSNSLKNEHLPWNPSNNGTSTNPITFKAYPGETPVFLDNIWGGAIGAVDRSWIIWDGFSGTIVDSPGEVIFFAYFDNASNCVIRNSKITGVLKNTHQNAALIFLLKNTNILIENNQLHGMNDDGVAGGETAVNAAAILNFNTTGMIVKNNDIYNNYTGIWDKDTEQNNTYIQNHIWGEGTNTTRCHVGIQIREALHFWGAASNPQAYQNIIRNCSLGVTVSYDETNITAAKIYNNVIFYDDSLSDSESGIFVNPGASATEIYNNIIDGYSIPLRAATSTVGYSNQNNYFNSSSMQWRAGYTGPSYYSLDSWTSATGLDANSILTNPMFENAGGTNPLHYKLTDSSPILGAGRNGVNIGAYPASNSPSIGSSTIRPKSPVLQP